MNRYLREAVRQNPFWPECHRRIYRDVDRFHDPDNVAAAMTIALDSCGRKREQVDTPTKLIAVATRRLQQYDVPALFLERPLAESLLRSDLPAEMDLRELKLPFPAAAIVLPRGLLETPGLGPASFIAYARVHPGDIVELPGFPGRGRLDKDALIFFSGFFDDDGQMPMLALNIWLDETSTVGDLFTRALPSLETTAEGQPLQVGEREILHQLIQLGLSAIMAATARPEIVTPGSSRPVSRHKKSGTPIYEPRIIGRGYRYHTERGTAGSGAAKSPHWRRGHFRQQPYGPRTSRQHRTIWIEPIFVGGNL